MPVLLFLGGPACFNPGGTGTDIRNPQRQRGREEVTRSVSEDESDVLSE